MTDNRIAFDIALTDFRAFLLSQGLSDKLLWLTRDRVTAHRTTYWIYRPNDLTSDTISRRFYERTRTTSSSIRLDALGSIGDRTLCYVQDWEKDSRMLNFGTHQFPILLKVVNNPLIWTLLKVLNHIRGEAPFLKTTEIPNNAEQSAAGYPPQGVGSPEP